MRINWQQLNYNINWLRYDLIAGITTAAVVIPKAMAFAAIAGLPVEIGIYTALVPMIIYALLGSAKQLSVSTTTTIAILTAAEMAAIAPNGASGELIIIAAVLAFLVGVFLLLASLLRLGFLANFISAPVLTGFKAGIAIVIIVDQLPKIFGLHITKGNFIYNIITIIQHLPAASIATLILAILSLIIIFGMEWFFPRMPAPLLVLVIGIFGSFFLGFQHRGISLIGAIPAGLPSFSLVKFSLIEKLWPGALGIALISFTESIAAGKLFVEHGEIGPNANRELFALGAANLIGSFFQTMPAGGGTSQTVINNHAGAKTQVAELVTAILAILVLLFLTPLISKIPNATLAAIVIATSVLLLNPAEFIAILKIRKLEFAWAIAALIGVILFGVLNGIAVAILLSLLTLIYQANHPPVYVLGRKKGTHDVFRPLKDHPNDETFSGMLIIRTEGRLTFASIPQTRAKFNKLIGRYKPKVLVLDLSAVPDIEYTALLNLIEAEERLQKQGIELQLASLNPEALEVVRRSDLGKRLGDARMFFNLEEAVNTFSQKK